MSAPASGTRVPCRAGVTAPQGCGSSWAVPFVSPAPSPGCQRPATLPSSLDGWGGSQRSFPVLCCRPRSSYSPQRCSSLSHSHETHREAGGHHAHHRATWQVPQGTPQGPGKAAGSDREGRVTVPEWTCTEGRATGRGGWGCRCVCGDVRAPACM